ncbi:MAG TPA: isoprenylcysteine carboxylmethyltransferase family protein [Noviherbaspirillum sp.]
MGQRGESWVAVQAVLLLAIIFAPATGAPWPGAPVFRTAGWAGIAVGAAILAWSAWNLGRSLTPFPRPVAEGQLVTRGAYRFVRHPIYFGVLLTALGFALLTMNPLRMALTVVLFVFFDRKARREEQWLMEKYPDYAAYRRRVRRLIPWIY